MSGFSSRAGGGGPGRSGRSYGSRCEVEALPGGLSPELVGRLGGRRRLLVGGVDGDDPVGLPYGRQLLAASHQVVDRAIQEIAHGKPLAHPPGHVADRIDADDVERDAVVADPVHRLYDLRGLRGAQIPAGRVYPGQHNDISAGIGQRDLLPVLVGQPEVAGLLARRKEARPRLGVVPPQVGHGEPAQDAQHAAEHEGQQVSAAFSVQSAAPCPPRRRQPIRACDRSPAPPGRRRPGRVTRPRRSRRPRARARDPRD